jgi:hypothetical protein
MQILSSLLQPAAYPVFYSHKMLYIPWFINIPNHTNTDLYSQEQRTMDSRGEIFYLLTAAQNRAKFLQWHYFHN